jgi:ketosteroid isomerase-like protein
MVPLAAWLVLGCAPGSQEELTPTDVTAVQAVLADYRQAWIANDADRVMSHLSDEFTLYVPGATASTLKGKDRIRPYWFPPSDTVYRITQYEITDPETHGGGRYAVAQGTSALAWEMVVKDSVHMASTSRSEFVTVLRREGESWKLFRQIYVLR